MAAASAGLAVTQAEQHFVVDLASELPWQGVKVVALFSHELIGIDLSDESAETFAELRQLNLYPKPYARIPVIALIPQSAYGETSVRGLVLIVKTRTAEKPSNHAAVEHMDL